MLSDFLNYYLFDYEIEVYPHYTDLKNEMIKKKMHHFSQVLMKNDKNDNRILGITACFYDKKGVTAKCKSNDFPEVVQFENDTIVNRYFNGHWQILVLPYFLYENKQITAFKKRKDENKINLFNSYKEYDRLKRSSEFIWRKPFWAENIQRACKQLKRETSAIEKNKHYRKAYQKLYCLIVFDQNANVGKDVESTKEFAKRFADAFALTIKEWGLDILREDVVKHATRAAVAAIMGRNMSHNIGSHVLSYWKQGLSVENEQLSACLSSLKALIREPHPTLEKVTGLISEYKLLISRYQYDKSKDKINNNCIEQSYFMFDYLKDRMDFIAEITTTPPSWEKSMHLQKDILDQFKKQKALLNDIIKSEGFCYCEILKYCQKYKARQSSSTATSNPSCMGCNLYSGNDLSEQPEPYTLTIDESCNDKMVSIPHGNIGIQAVFSILENLMRNSAKHGGRIIKQEMKENNIGHFDICVKANETTDKNYVALTISDNVGNCNRVIRESNGNEISIVQYLNKALEDSRYVDEKGKLIKGRWGIKEVKLSANFLRGRDTDSLTDDTLIKEGDETYPLMHLSCYDANLCLGKCSMQKGKENIAFTIYLRKPKEVCIVYGSPRDKTIKALLKHEEKLKSAGIDLISSDDLISTIKAKNNIPHRFLVLVKEKLITESELKDYAVRLPYRIIEKADFTLLTRDKSDEFISALYKEYCDKRFQLKRTKIFVSNRISFWAMDDLCFKYNNAEDIVAFNKRQYSIIFDDHGENCKKEIIANYDYYHPCGNTIGASFYTFISAQPQNEIRHQIALYELVEMAKTKVVIADERIYKNNLCKEIEANEKIFTDNRKASRIELLMEKMGVSIIQVKGDTIDPKDVYEDTNKGDFLVIHQGLLDKMTEGNRSKFLDKIIGTKKKKGIYSNIVIDSGRGVPEKLIEGARYIEIGTIERFIENLDKYALVQTLFSLRRPKDV